MENPSRLKIPSEFNYVLVDYHSDPCERPITIGVVLQSENRLLFRFLTPDDADDLIPEFSKELVFQIETSFLRDQDKGVVQIHNGEGNERRAVSVYSYSYLEYLHSSFLNTITFTEPKKIIASDSESLIDSLFRDYVLRPAQEITFRHPLTIETLTDGLILLFHVKNDEPIAGSTKLQKLTFLLKKETKLGKKLKEEFTYVPYHLGPYSTDLESMVEVLREEGLIEIEEKPQVDPDAEADRKQAQKLEQDSVPPEKNRTMRIYKLSSEGKALAEELARSTPRTDLEEISKLKERFNSASTRTIIDYVYARYENMTTRSKLKKVKKERS